MICIENKSIKVLKKLKLQIYNIACAYQAFRKDSRNSPVISFAWELTFLDSNLHAFYISATFEISETNDFSFSLFFLQKLRSTVPQNNFARNILVLLAAFFFSD